MAIVLFIIIALFTGREVTFWPPKIGAKIVSDGIATKGKAGEITPGVKEDYGVKILFPEAGAEVSGNVRISGTFAKLPSVGSMWLIVLNNKTNEYWPREELVFDPKDNTWHVNLYVSSTTMQDVSRTMIVYSVGEYAKALIEFQSKVRKEKKVYVGLDYSNIIKDDMHRQAQVKFRLLRSIK